MEKIKINYKSFVDILLEEEEIWGKNFKNVSDGNIVATKKIMLIKLKEELEEIKAEEVSRKVENVLNKILKELPQEKSEEDLLMHLNRILLMIDDFKIDGMQKYAQIISETAVVISILSIIISLYLQASDLIDKAGLDKIGARTIELYIFRIVTFVPLITFGSILIYLLHFRYKKNPANNIKNKKISCIEIAIIELINSEKQI